MQAPNNQIFQRDKRTKSMGLFVRSFVAAYLWKFTSYGKRMA